MRPVIGITSYFVKAYEITEYRSRGIKGQDMLMSTMDYSKSVERAGGLPVIIPVIRSPSYIEDIVKKIDGLILTGGPDVYPLIYDTSMYRDCKRVVSERDRFELELLEKSLENDIPIFGICRGFHLLNIHFGGTLYQDIYRDNLTDIAHSGSKAPPYEPCHSVFFEKGCLFDDVCGETITVNSYHHQAIKKLGKGLKAVGWSCEDKLIEAILHESNKSLLAVQWHPEMMTEHSLVQMKIFEYFINLVINEEEKNEN